MSANAKNKPPPLLVVEDDEGLQGQLKWCLADYDVHFASDRAGAIALLRRLEPAVVTLDLGLPPDPTNASEGFAALNEIIELKPDTKVVVVTGNDERANAVRAVSMGAYDFYEKPVDPDALKLIVQRAFKLHELEEENARLVRRVEAESSLQGVVAVGPEMSAVCRLVERVAPADVGVLLLGESGTGKELLARAVHDLSPRGEGKGRFVVINCAAIPETLLESELFGYEKGAFTGAYKQKTGKIELADGGTLFLDEIGDLPQSLQAKLLRFLQERTIERVGGHDTIEVDVRVVCATHRDLASMRDAGEFREDLFYRINEVAVNIPPLRERHGDAVALARSFLRSYSESQGRQVKDFSEDALRAIEGYGWPGNARELENRVKRAVIMAEGPRVKAEDLDLEPEGNDATPLNLRQVREAADRRAIQRAMALHGDRITQVAEALGITRPTLYHLLERYGMR